MIDGETGERTIDTLVKTQDEVRLSTGKDLQVVLHFMFLEPVVECHSPVSSLAAVHRSGRQNLHVRSGQWDRLQVSNVSHFVIFLYGSLSCRCH